MKQRLVMNVGVMPRLYSIEAIIKSTANVNPFALGHALPVEIDRAEEAK